MNVSVGLLNFDNFSYTVHVGSFSDVPIGSAPVEFKSTPITYELEYIRIADLPKTVYRINEDFDPTGMTLDLIFRGSDGSETVTTIDVTEDMVSGFVNGVVGFHEMVVAYEGFTDFFTVLVRYIYIDLGEEKQGGAGYMRSIEIESGVDLTDMYLIVKAQYGIGEDAKIMVLCIAADKNAVVSYPMRGSVIEVYLTNTMPNLTGSEFGAVIYGGAGDNWIVPPNSK